MGEQEDIQPATSVCLPLYFKAGNISRTCAPQIRNEIVHGKQLKWRGTWSLLLPALMTSACAASRDLGICELKERMLLARPPWQGAHHGCARQAIELQGFLFLPLVAPSPSLSETVSVIGARTCCAGQRETWEVRLPVDSRPGPRKGSFLLCCVC